MVHVNDSAMACPASILANKRIINANGFGIGKIGGNAMDAMARQPEKIGELRSAMIIAAALVEGVAFFAVIIALLALFV